MGSKPNGILKVCDSLDPFRSGGPATAVRRKFHSVATQGGLTVALRPIKQNPQIAGIIIDGYSYSDALLEDLPTAPASPADRPDFSSLSSIGPRPPADATLIYDPSLNPKFNSPSPAFPVSSSSGGALQRSSGLGSPSSYGRSSGSLFSGAANVKASYSFSGSANSGAAAAPPPTGSNGGMQPGNRYPSGGVPGAYGLGGGNGHLLPSALMVRPSVGYRRLLASYTPESRAGDVDMAARLESLNSRIAQEQMALASSTNAQPSVNDGASAPIRNFNAAQGVLGVSSDHYGISDPAQGASPTSADSSSEAGASDSVAPSSASAQFRPTDTPHASLGRNEAASRISGPAQAVNQAQTESMQSTQRASPGSFVSSHEAPLSSERHFDSPQSPTLEVLERPQAETARDASNGVAGHLPNERQGEQFPASRAYAMGMGTAETPTTDFGPQHNPTRSSFGSSPPTPPLRTQTEPYGSRADDSYSRLASEVPDKQRIKDVAARISLDGLRAPIVSRVAHEGISAPHLTQPDELGSPQTANVDGTSGMGDASGKGPDFSKEAGGNREAMRGRAWGARASQEHTYDIHPLSGLTTGHASLPQDFAGRGAAELHRNSLGIEATGPDPITGAYAKETSYPTPAAGTSSARAERGDLDSPSQQSAETAEYGSVGAFNNGDHDPDPNHAMADRSPRMEQPPSVRTAPGLPPGIPGLPDLSDIAGMVGGDEQRQEAAPKPGIHNGNSALEGMCIDNSTHCSCGMATQRPGQGDECLFVVNEERTPMICVRRACSGRFICACANGANTLCQRTLVNNILVPASTHKHGVTEDPNVLFCRREELSQGVAILTPII